MEGQTATGTAGIIGSEDVPKETKGLFGRSSSLDSTTIAPMPRTDDLYVMRPTLVTKGALRAFARLQQKLADEGRAELLDGVSICYMDSRHKPLLIVSGVNASQQTVILCQNKAYTALMLDRDTMEVGPRMRELHVAPPSYGNDRITDFAGGVRCWNQKVGVIGGVGLSGLSPTEDHDLAIEARDLVLAPFPEFDIPTVGDPANAESADDDGVVA